MNKNRKGAMNHLFIILLVFISAFLLSACSQKQQDPDKTPAESSAADASVDEIWLACTEITGVYKGIEETGNVIYQNGAILRMEANVDRSEQYSLQDYKEGNFTSRYAKIVLRTKTEDIFCYYIETSNNPLTDPASIHSLSDLDSIKIGDSITLFFSNGEYDIEGENINLIGRLILTNSQE